RSIAAYGPLMKLATSRTRTPSSGPAMRSPLEDARLVYGRSVDRLRVIAFSRPAAFVVAEGEGFFVDESLAVEYTQARGSAPQLDALVRGEFDLAHTAADNIVMRVDRDGADIAVVCV